jgi:hypothetical protein
MYDMTAGTIMSLSQVLGAARVPRPVPLLHFAELGVGSSISSSSSSSTTSADSAIVNAVAVTPSAER